MNNYFTEIVNAYIIIICADLIFKDLIQYVQISQL